MTYALFSFTAPASQGPYAVPFGFLESTDLRVSVNGVAGATFSVSGVNLTIVTPTIVGGETVIFTRGTDRSAPVVDFTDGGTLEADDLDRAFLQDLYILQEILDSGAGTVGSGLPSSASGGLHWDAQSLQIKALATGTAGTDAVNLTQMNAAISAALVTGGLPFVGGQWDARVAAVNKKLNFLADPSATLGADLQVAATKAFVLANIGNTLPSVTVADNNDFLTVVAGVWAATLPAAARTAMGLGSAAVLTQGIGIGNLPALVDVGAGTPGFPAIDGRNLVNVPTTTGLAEAVITPSATVLPVTASAAPTWYQAGSGATNRLALNAITQSANNANSDITVGGAVTDGINLKTGTYRITMSLGVQLVTSQATTTDTVDWAFAKSDGSATALSFSVNPNLARLSFGALGGTDTWTHNAPYNATVTFIVVVGSLTTYRWYARDKASATTILAGTQMHIKRIA